MISKKNLIIKIFLYYITECIIFLDYITENKAEMEKNKKLKNCEKSKDK